MIVFQSQFGVQPRDHGPGGLIENEVTGLGVTPNPDDRLVEFTSNLLVNSTLFGKGYSHTPPEILASYSTVFTLRFSTLTLIVFVAHSVALNENKPCAESVRNVSAR